MQTEGPLVGAEPVAGDVLFVIGGADGRARVARVRDGVVVGSFDQHAPITSVAVSRDGRHALTGGADGSAVLWSIPTGTPEHRLDGAERSITRVAFAPAGNLVLAASADGAVRTYDVATGDLAATLPHASRVRDAAFSADGRLVATTVGDRRVRIWDGRTARRVKTLDHGGFALSVAFDPTGSFLATTGADKTLRLWDARTWNLDFERVRTVGPGSAGGIRPRRKNCLGLFAPTAAGPSGVPVTVGCSDG